MRISINPNIVFLLLLIIGACEDPYFPELKDYEGLLVVDALISEQDSIYVVKLSRSTTIAAGENSPFVNCTVSIIDNEGNKYQLSENDPGIYCTVRDKVKLQRGQSCFLRIITQDGDIYESEMEAFYPAVGIDSVYAAYEYKESASFTHQREGYQFFVTTGPINHDQVYFLWQLEETWKYQSDFYIDYLYRGLYLEENTDFDSLYTCYRTKNVFDLFCFEADGLLQASLRGIPLHFVDTESRKLSLRYSVLVKQYCIGENAYHYFSELKSLISEKAGLFQNQPYYVKGNIHKQGDADAMVLGSFVLASEQNKRIFIDRPIEAHFYYDRCTLNTDLMGLRFFSTSQYPLYLAEDEHGDIGIADKACFDCRLHGGSLKMPDFWYE